MIVYYVCPSCDNDSVRLSDTGFTYYCVVDGCDFEEDVRETEAKRKHALFMNTLRMTSDVMRDPFDFFMGYSNE